LPDSTSVFSFAVNGGTLLIGTSKGVFFLKNNGANWIAFNTGLPAKTSIDSLVACGDYLVAGTDSGNVWRRPLSETPVEKHQENLPCRFSFTLKAPTRQNHNLTVDFFPPRAEKAAIAIYDLSGHQVAALVDKPLAAGPHSFIYDTRNLATDVTP